MAGWGLLGYAGRVMSPAGLRLVYNGSLLSLRPLILALYLRRVARTGRERETWAYRVGKRRYHLVPKPPSLWLHGVSLGEVNLCLHLSRAILARYPRAYFFLSTVTDTGFRALRQKLGEAGEKRKRAGFVLPLDFPDLMRPLVRQMRPAALWIAETELWPNLILEARRANVPVVVFNARLSDKSFPAYRRWRRFLRPLLREVGLIMAQSELDADRFRLLGAPADRVVVTGNCKADFPAPRVSGDQQRALRRLFRLEGRFVLVAGSTHETEERLLLAACRPLKGALPPWTLILAPRHPERSEAVLAEAKAEGFSVARRTEVGGGLAGPAEVIILDTVGELAQFYALADLCFVGGSLAPVGGHNFLEAVALKKPVVMGKQVRNVEDLVLAFAGCKGVRLVEKEELPPLIRRCLADQDNLRRAGAEAYARLQGLRGATQRTLDAFQNAFPEVSRALEELV